MKQINTNTDFKDISMFDKNFKTYDTRVEEENSKVTE